MRIAAGVNAAKLLLVFALLPCKPLLFGLRDTARRSSLDKTNNYLLTLRVTRCSDYGFDPAGFSKDPVLLARFREAEVIHCRWAMLGAVRSRTAFPLLSCLAKLHFLSFLKNHYAQAGIMAVEDLGYGSWLDAAEGMPYGTVPLTYFGNPVPFDLVAVNAVFAVSMAWVESARSNEKDAMKRIYPGFDPLGLAKGGLGRTGEELKAAEIKNGRLSMLARPLHPHPFTCCTLELYVPPLHCMAPPICYELLLRCLCVI